MRFKKLLSVFAAAALSLSTFTEINFPCGSAPSAWAADTAWKFDLGGSGTASGYTGVSAADAYNPSKGYGFTSTGSVSDVAAMGSGAYSDAVQFKSADSTNVFKVDLPEGAYSVKVVTGNVSRTTINIEGIPQMINLTGNNAAEAIEIPVTDGSLEIQAVAGRANTAFSISAIEITQINTTGETAPTIWICGDSTVASYYNVSDSSQHGWGQFLEDNVDSDYWQVRNLAASGQYAKGFIDAGQFKPVEKYGKKGDVYLVSIGINDTNYSTAIEYYTVVTDMVKTAKSKGVEVILVKQQGRRGDLQRSPLLSSRWFAGELDQIGDEQNVEVINLFKAWQDFGLGIGYNGMAEYYAVKADGTGDDLHQSMKGAKKLAELVAKLHNFKTDGGNTTPIVTNPPVTQPPMYGNVLLGDANCDGKVTIADAAAIFQYLGNRDKYSLSEQGEINADVTGGGITAADAIFIQKYDAGMEQLPQYIPPATTDSRLFAVDQKWTNGATETVNEGYTKAEGYVNLDNQLDSEITFTANVPEKDNYHVHIRFANGSPNDRKMKIIVNGDTNSYWLQSFPTTGAWTEWAEYGIVLPLNSGKNTIQLVSATNEGGPNLDYIKLTLTEEPYAEFYAPSQEQQPSISSKPTIFIAGDSTVQSYKASYAPQQGWGYYLADYFNDNVTVANHSLAGRSTKKFYDEGRWQTILDSLKDGDYVMIQFSINDAGKANADRYAPICGNINNPTAGSYEWYMTEFIRTAKEKGATPVLVTTVIGMKAFSGDKFVNSYTEYCNACKQLSAKYNVPCIDLNSIMVSHYNSVGYDTAKSYHLMGAVSGSTDGTHFCEKGANIVAGLVANEVKAQGLTGLAENFK